MRLRIYGRQSLFEQSCKESSTMRNNIAGQSDYAAKIFNISIVVTNTIRQKQLWTQHVTQLSKSTAEASCSPKKFRAKVVTVGIARLAAVALSRSASHQTHCFYALCAGNLRLRCQELRKCHRLNMA